MKASQRFLQLALTCVGEDRGASTARDLLREAEDGYGISPMSVSKLLDRSKWKGERPKIRLRAEINQIGNFIVMWRPTIDDALAKTEDDFEFDSHFLGQVVLNTSSYGNLRPMGELIWFRDVPRTINLTSKADDVAEFAICCGLIEKYRELVAQLGEHLELSEVTPVELVPRGTQTLGWSVG